MTIESAARDTVDLEECIEELNQASFDASDQESFLAVADSLKRLANNSDFLGDLVVDELKLRCRNQVESNDYSSQVIMLHKPEQNYFLRANMWPAEQDYAVRASGYKPFYYGVAHDHNFDFLTVGYAGPGYWSDYYEYDYGAVDGFVGEKVDLKFAETSQLSEGKMLLYRAHLDVHRQRPPESLSVSLNIMQMKGHHSWLDQYCFDLEMGEISDVVTHVASETLLKLAVHVGSENAIDLATSFAKTHPTDRMRYAAWKAIGSVISDAKESRSFLEAGLSNETTHIRHHSQEMLEINSSR